MKLLNNRPNNNALAKRSTPGAQAIRRRYGDMAAFATSWSVEHWNYVAMNLPKAWNTPTLIEMCHAYGEELITQILRQWLATSLGLAGIAHELTDNRQQQLVALMMANENVRTLNFAHVLTFFVWFAQGRLETFGNTPFQIMKCVNRYCVEASARAYRHATEARQQMEKQQDAQRQKECITYDEFCRRTGTKSNISNTTKR